MDSERYLAVKEASQTEIVIKKSRFICHAKPVSTEEEAMQFIESIRKNHWSATHNCFAYCIGQNDQLQKQSDDGEPSGTAGKPILEVIKNKRIKNVAIVVTRYFGGIMLGAGGLIRAYASGASAALESAGIIEKALHQQVTVTMDYTLLGKVENEVRNRNMMTEETLFTDKVTLICLPFYSEADNVIKWMTELTQGKAEIEKGKSYYIDHEHPSQ
ncbi:YigZ family protein [Longirhabdus pacifica]|uniref:YigZ family protein n=1 Tax=Longirhabdus pacifica TaxID=2305227 RepID=UPI00100887CF|nr:YigZ family protein [Longirhabdus pacifica]